MNEMRELIRVARDVLALETPFWQKWEKGYKAGMSAAYSVEWCIWDVIEIARIMAGKCGVPELKRAETSFKRGQEDWDPCADLNYIKRIANNTLRKAKRHGVAGIAGAIAGVLEDANAHDEAGVIYSLARNVLEDKYGDVIGTMPIVGNIKVARELIAVARELIGKLPPRYAYLVPDRGKISFSIRLGKDYETAAVERLGQELSKMVKKDLRGTSFRYRLSDPWIARGTGGDHLMVTAKGNPYYEQEIAMALKDFILTK